jgi:integrase/recombinase XerC
MLAATRKYPRDFAILQLFLQTGIRVSEVIAICLPDLDLEHKTLLIPGKGSKERVIPLEKKALQALKSYLSVRPKTTDQHLFLNYRGEGLTIGGVRKMVEKYAKRADITRNWVIRTFDDATVRSHKAPSDEADRSSLGRSLVA